jgi:hypothetical protein
VVYKQLSIEVAVLIVTVRRWFFLGALQCICTWSVSKIISAGAQPLTLLSDYVVLSVSQFYTFHESRLAELFA